MQVEDRRFSFDRVSLATGLVLRKGLCLFEYISAASAPDMGR